MDGLVELADPADINGRFVGAEGLNFPTTGSGLPAVMPQSQGDLTINAFGTVITAQRVAVPRNHQRIMQTLKALCAMAGDAYVYSWTVNDKRNQRKETIEGPTIKLANDLVRTYGNCGVGVKVEEHPDHTMFYATFADFETGYSLIRPFRQRKKQNIGEKYDSERAADMVFQIGASKAIRNVVVNALSTYADFMVEEAKNNLIQKVGADPDRAHAFIDKVAERHGIEISRVEAVIGRKRDKWTVRDLARVYQEMRGVHEGLTVADEVYPSAEAAVEVMKAKIDADAPAGKTDGAKAEGDKQPRRTGRGKLSTEESNQDGAAQDQKPADGGAQAAAEPGQTGEPGATEADKPVVFQVVGHDGLTSRAEGIDAAATALKRYIAIADLEGSDDDLIKIRNANARVLVERPELAQDISDRLQARAVKRAQAAQQTPDGGNDKPSGNEPKPLFGDE